MLSGWETLTIHNEYHILGFSSYHMVEKHFMTLLCDGDFSVVQCTVYIHTAMETVNGIAKFNITDGQMV